MEEAAAIFAGLICTAFGLVLPLIAFGFALAARSRVVRLEAQVLSLSHELQALQASNGEIRQFLGTISDTRSRTHEAVPGEVGQLAGPEGEPTVEATSADIRDEEHSSVVGETSASRIARLDAQPDSAADARDTLTEEPSEPTLGEETPADAHETATEDPVAEAVSEPGEPTGAEPSNGEAAPSTPAAAEPTAETVQPGEGAVPEQPVQPPAEQTPRDGPSPPLSPEEAPPATLEQRLALTWLSRAGAVALLAGVAYGYKYAVDSEWIGPWGRVGLGTVVGLAILAGATWVRMHRIFRQVLLGVGVATLSVAAYASYGFYDLVPVWAAFSAVAVVALFGGSLAYYHRSEAILILALITGLANPVLLSTGRDQALGLFAYLLVLTGVSYVATVRLKFVSPVWIALSGTLLLSMGWYWRFYDISPLEADQRFEVLNGEIAAEAGAYFAWQARIVPLLFVVLFGALWIGTRFYARWTDRERTHLKVLPLVAMSLMQLGGCVLLPDEPLALGIWVSVLAGLTVPLLVRSDLQPVYMAIPTFLSFAGLLYGLARGDDLAPFIGAGITIVWTGATISGLVHRALSGQQGAASSRWVLTAILPLFAVLFGVAVLPDYRAAYCLGMTVAALLYLVLALRLKWDLSILLTLIVTGLAMILAGIEVSRPAAILLAISSGWALVHFVGLAIPTFLLRQRLTPLRLLSLSLAAVFFVTLVLLLTGGDVPTLRALLIFGLALVFFAFGTGLIVFDVSTGEQPGPHLLLGECLTCIAISAAILFSGIEFSVAFLALGTVTAAIAAGTRRGGWLVASLTLVAIGLVHVAFWDFAQPYLDHRLFLSSLGEEGQLRPAIVTNARAYGLAATAVSCLLAGWLLIRSSYEQWDISPLVSRIVGFAGVALGHVALLADFVLEVRNAARPWPSPPPAGLDSHEFGAFLDLVAEVQEPSIARIGLLTTLVVGVYGTSLLVGGFVFRSAFHRYLGLCTLLLTVGKLAAWDIWTMTRGYQVVVLISVGVLLLGSGFLYARFGNRLVALIRDGSSTVGVLLLLLGGLATSILPGTALAETVDPAQYESRCQLEGVGSPGLYRFIVSPELLRAIPHPMQPSLRIADDTGVEVPYLVRPITPPSSWQPLQMFDSGLSSDGSVRAVFDLGADRQRHNMIELDLQGHNYVRRVKVESSDDGSTYTLIRRGPVVYSVDNGGAYGRVTYALSQARFLRVTLLAGDGHNPRIRGGRVTHMDHGVTSRHGTIPLTIVSNERIEESAGAGQHSSVLTLDTGAAGVPISALRFQIGPGAFERRVHVASTNYKRVWPRVASGWIYRAADVLGGEDLEVSLPSTRKRYWKVSIFDGNDQPIPIVSVAGSYAREEVVLSARKAGAHRVYVTSEKGRAHPAYDLERVLGRTGATSITDLRLGPIEQNPEHSSVGQPRPGAFTERYKTPISLILALAMVVLALLTLFLLWRSRQRNAPQPSDQPTDNKEQNPEQPLGL